MSMLSRALGALAACLLLPGSLMAQEAVNPLVPELSVPAGELVADEAPPSPAASPGGAPFTRENVDTWLDGYMPYAIRQADLVGAVVTVVKDGEILTSRGFGYADLAARQPVDGYETMFRPGSISKLFTWIAVMQLVEQGRIDLDTDINTYLDIRMPEAHGAPITMRQLMTHTAGFQEKLRNLILTDASLHVPLGQFMVETQPPARVFAPGTTPAYSNYGTALAGYVVQLVSGEDFDDYVETHIFRPLGMQRATFRQPLPAEFEPFMSNGYNSASEGKAQPYEIIPMSPAGSVAADGDAMGRFMIGLLERNPAIMRPETWEQFFETLDSHSPPLNAMALGIWQLDKGNLRIRGHGGDTIYFHSDLNVFIDKGAGIYVSVNSTGTGASAVRFGVTTDFAARYFPESVVPVGERLSTAKEHGQLVAGTYEPSRTVFTNFVAIMRYLGQHTIAMNEEGDLVFSLLGDKTVWREVEPFVWRHVDGYERLTAVLDDNGKVSHLTFEPLAPIIHYQPAPWYRTNSLLTPLVMLSILALLATLVMWPVRILVRRHYRTPFPHSGREALAYRLTRIGIVLVFVFLIAWLLVFQTLFTNLSALTGGFVVQLRLAQFTQLLLYAGLAISAWNVWVVWSSGQSWFARIWSIVLMISMLIILLFAATNSLLSLETNF